MEKLCYCIIAIVIAVWIYRILHRIYLVMKIRSTVKDAGAESIRCWYLPQLFCINGKYDIVYTLMGKRHNIVLLVVHDRRARYFFKNERTIERYVATMFFAKGTKNYARRAEWNEKRSIKLPWHNVCENDITFLVLSRFPTEVADGSSRTTTLGNGDKIQSGILLYDVKHFAEHIKNTDR